jgi:NADH-quinone oxidoreductase subunit J
MEAVFFWFFAIGLLLSALAVVLNRNAVACALSLVLSILFQAGLFAMLQAFFLATIQVLVYAGAVMVLFLFIIMLLNLKEEERRPRNWLGVGLGLALAAGLGWEFNRVIGHLPGAAEILSARAPDAGDDVRALGHLLFTKYLLPFEVTSLLLLVAVIGVVLLSKRENGAEKS